MRVAFTLIGGKDWTGGYNYLLNLFDVLIRHQAARLTAVMFVGEDCGEESAPFQAIEGLELVRTPFLNARRRKTSLLQAVLWGRDANMQRVFRQHCIDMVFEAAPFLGWRFGIPVVAWIPDFQHNHRVREH